MTISQKPLTAPQKTHSNTYLAQVVLLFEWMCVAVFNLHAQDIAHFTGMPRAFYIIHIFSFAIRPIGALFISRIYSQNPSNALKLTLVFMLCGSILIVTGPIVSNLYTLNSFYVFILILLGRFAQCFAIGGSYGASYTYTYQKTCLYRPREVFRSLSQVSGSFLLGMIIGNCIYNTVKFCSLPWESSFIVVILLNSIALYGNLPENFSLNYEKPTTFDTKITQHIPKRLVIKSMCAVMLDMAGFYILCEFIGIALQSECGSNYILMHKTLILISTIGAGYLLDLVTLITNTHCFYIARRTLIVISIIIGSISLAAPWTSLLYMIITSLVLSFTLVTLPIYLISLSHKYGSYQNYINFIYNISALIASTMPFIAQLLIENELTIGWMSAALSVTALIGFII